MPWPGEQIQYCWVDELQGFSLSFVQYFLISTFMFRPSVLFAYNIKQTFWFCTVNENQNSPVSQ